MFFGLSPGAYSDRGSRAAGRLSPAAQEVQVRGPAAPRVLQTGFPVLQGEVCLNLRTFGLVDTLQMTIGHVSWYRNLIWIFLFPLLNSVTVYLRYPRCRYLDLIYQQSGLLKGLQITLTALQFISNSTDCEICNIAAQKYWMFSISRSGYSDSLEKNILRSVQLLKIFVRINLWSRARCDVLLKWSTSQSAYAIIASTGHHANWKLG